MKSRGFTLVELVVVIVITGIVSASVMVFFKPALDGYFDTARRATLTDVADTALRRIGRDIRSAVPNSIRTPGDQCFELLPTSTGGRYRMESDTVNAGSLPLDIRQPVTQFDVLSPMSTTPAVGDWVVIGNQNANDVYAGVTRAAVSAAPTTPAVTSGLHRLTVSSTQFPSAYDGGRFFVVPENAGKPAVFYVCSNATGVDADGNGNGILYRLTRDFDATYPASCPSTAGAAILANHVKSCSFVYDPNQGATQQSGFVWMQIELAESDEVIALSYGAHVDNVP